MIHALERAECVIVHDAYHPTETSRYADILLPGAVWAEAEGTMVNSERTVTLMQKAVEPPGEARPDWEIVARVACAMGFADSFTYRNAEEVFQEIRRMANPLTGYDLRGISYDRLRSASIQWPCPSVDQPGQAIRYTSRATDESAASTPPKIRFATASGKGCFYARPHLPPAELPSAEYPFILTTGRTAHQWHTMTKTGKVPALNKLNAHAFVEINPEDATALELTADSMVEVASLRGRAVYPARITDKIRPGCCFAPIHWNDMFGEKLAVNATTSEAVDPISKQPEFKFCAVRLSKISLPPKAAPVVPLIQKGELSDFFTPAQQAHLRKLFEDSAASMVMFADQTISFPPHAPFTAAQREWLGKTLAECCRLAPSR